MTKAKVSGVIRFTSSALVQVVTGTGEKLDAVLNVGADHPAVGSEVTVETTNGITNVVPAEKKK